MNSANRAAPEGLSSKKEESFLQKLVGWIVTAIAFPFVFAGFFMEEFTEPGKKGAILLGSFVFMLGMFMSADTYWQMLGGTPLFGFFEEEWLGYRWVPGFQLFPPRFWLGAWSSPMLWISLIFSCVTQTLQSYFFNGDGKLFSQKTGLNPKAVGFLAIASAAFEVILTFAARNPLRYADPGLVLGCLLYNLLSIVAAELGRTVYKAMKG